MAGGSPCHMKNQNNVKIKVAYTKHFNTYVSSLRNYGCEIWGIGNANVIQRVHLEYIISVLTVGERYK